MSTRAPSPIGESPVQAVLLCRRFEFERPQRFESTSLPGHLIHWVSSGHVRQQCNGRWYELRPGTVIWYHEDELVRGEVLSAPWIFNSVNFVAPALPPPAESARLFHPPVRAMGARFARLLAAWEDRDAPAGVRAFRVHAALLDVLGELTTPAQLPLAVDQRARLWWTLESALRRDLRQPIDLARMERISGASIATIARSCHHAVGMPPLRRMKQIRMSLARGLVERSQLTMSEIAAEVGYARVHELSRDFRRHFGEPPTQLRRRARAAGD